MRLSCFLSVYTLYIFKLLTHHRWIASADNDYDDGGGGGGVSSGDDDNEICVY